MRSGRAVLSSLLLFAIIPAIGCTHMQLQRNTNRQARTVADIYERQVLDNLAMFVTNPYATPFFSVPTQGTNGVDDKGTLTLSAPFLTGNFWSNVASEGSRDISENWTLNPVIVPVRLKLMQCAYQHAMGVDPDNCNQCCDLERAWNDGKCNHEDPCGITCGWVCYSTRWRDVPKCCCQQYGFHCGTYVWVAPGCEHEFSKLVMKVAAYASNDKPSSDQEEVTLYLRQDAKTLGTVDDHSIKVITNVDTGTSLTEIQKTVTQMEMQKLLDDASKTPNPTTEQLTTIINKANLLQMSPGIEMKANKFFEGGQNLSNIDARDKLLRNLPTQVQQPRRSIDFGAPAQYNSGYIGGGIMQLQQRLNTVPLPRR